MEVLVTVNPDRETDVSLQPTVKSNSFVDGYTQDYAQGAFNSPRTLSVRWSNLTLAEANPLIDFLETRRGYQRFLWTAPEEPQRVYKCTRFSYKWKQGRRCDLSATFVEQAG